MVTTEPVYSHRYHILRMLGAGGTGRVYAARDRLSGKQVALKQLILPPNPNNHALQQELITFANEFRYLAGLRHPHIISVLDYGFDQQRRPFYTMDLLENAQSILSAGYRQPLNTQMNLLLQALEALAYLHRRGILHHDLKPENMLVYAGTLRLLDFGLAVVAGQKRDDDAFGTLQYLAPEVLDGHAYTEASDLYSFGVIAYQLLLGRHPFPAETIDSFIQQVFNSRPDLSLLASQPQLAQVLATLLEPDPAKRPASAQTSMHMLRLALNLAIPEESQAIRESYLQAASFVGRDAELTQLMQVLESVQQGRSQGWLIGGESGVGKSRLLDELRTRALVAGFQVVQGQGRADSGGRPYELWLEPLRQWLVSASALDEHSLSVLVQLIPNIHHLMGRPIAPAPQLPAEAAQERLYEAIGRLIAAQPQPVMLVLEDLHWAEASLLPIPILLRKLVNWPLLIIGSYRDDERPELPMLLPNMHTISLARLDSDAVAALSRAMLGEVGHEPTIISFLQRETEGNAFFAVEVVRALVEEAGRLEWVGHFPLPDTLLPRGIQQLVLRRLHRVPRSAQPLLHMAAVVGRELDMTLLQHMANELDVEGWWLPICTELAIFDINDNRWRFSHDKIRETLLANLSEPALLDHHRQVAAALTQLYGSRPDYAATIAYHWQQAQEPAQERIYAELAGDNAQTQFLYTEAIAYYQRALDLCPVPTTTEAICQRVDLLNKLAARTVTQDTQHAQALADQALVLAQSELLGSDPYRLGIAEAKHTIANVMYQYGNYAQSIALLQAAYAEFERVGDSKHMVALAVNLAGGYWILGNYEQAEAYSHQMISIGEATNDLHAITRGYLGLAMVCEMLKREDEEVIYEYKALELARQVGDRHLEARILNNHVVTMANRNRYEEAIAYGLQGLAITREIGETANICSGLLNVAGCYVLLEKYTEAHACLAELRTLITGRGFGIIEVDTDVFEVELWHAQSQPERARPAIQRVEAALPLIESRLIKTQIYTILYNVYQALGETEKAAQYAQVPNLSAGQELAVAPE